MKVKGGIIVSHVLHCVTTDLEMTSDLLTGECALSRTEHIHVRIQYILIYNLRELPCIDPARTVKRVSKKGRPKPCSEHLCGQTIHSPSNGSFSSLVKLF